MFKNKEEIKKHMHNLFHNELAPHWDAENILFNWGVKALKSNEFIKARNYFETVLCINPINEKARKRMGEIEGLIDYDAELIKDIKPTLADSIIEKLNTLKTTITAPLQYEILCLGYRRSEKQENIYAADDKIVFSIFIPEEGILVVFHYDDERKIRVLYPGKEKDDIKVKHGETKHIAVEISKPIGKQYIKAILFPHGVTPLEEGAECISNIINIIQTISDIDKERWVVFDYEFEVV